MTSPIQIQTTSPPPLPGTALATSVNAALLSIATAQASAVAPTASGLNLTALSGVFWHDLSTGNLNIRDQADTVWIYLGVVNETTKTFTPAPAAGVALLASGAVSGVSHIPLNVGAVFCSAGSGGIASGFAAQLPSVSGVPNWEIFAVKTDGTTGVVIVNTSGASIFASGIALISGAVQLANQWQGVTVKADPTGSYWVVKAFT